MLRYLIDDGFVLRFIVIFRDKMNGAVYTGTFLNCYHETSQIISCEKADMKMER